MERVYFAAPILISPLFLCPYSLPSCPFCIYFAALFRSYCPLYRFISLPLFLSHCPLYRLISLPLFLSHCPLYRLISLPLFLSHCPLYRLISLPLFLSYCPLYRLISLPLFRSYCPLYRFISLPHIPITPLSISLGPAIIGAVISGRPTIRRLTRTSEGRRRTRKNPKNTKGSRRPMSHPPHHQWRGCTPFVRTSAYCLNL